MVLHTFLGSAIVTFQIHSKLINALRSRITCMLTLSEVIDTTIKSFIVNSARNIQIHLETLVLIRRISRFFLTWVPPLV